MSKFLDNLNNSSEFRGRHQTLKIHVQEKLYTHIFSRGAGVQESGKPPTAARPPGGGFRDFSILRFHAGFFRGFSRPLINHGERGCSRRKREKSTENGGALAKSGEFCLKSREIMAFHGEILQN